jgi:hypothetical protein
LFSLVSKNGTYPLNTPAKAQKNIYFVNKADYNRFEERDSPMREYSRFIAWCLRLGYFSYAQTGRAYQTHPSFIYMRTPILHPRAAVFLFPAIGDDKCVILSRARARFTP